MRPSTMRSLLLRKCVELHYSHVGLVMSMTIDAVGKRRYAGEFVYRKPTAVSTQTVCGPECASESEALRRLCLAAAKAIGSRLRDRSRKVK